MGRDSERRFQSTMDKLFHIPKATHSSSSGQSLGDKKCYHPASALAVVESKSSCSTVEAPICRPWDRDDLMRRLSTFKSMTWFAKPKVVSAVNCARRGWINVEMDTIACESCKARMLFSTPSAWTQETVNKTALAFSLKLDSGHKMLCPWMHNVCDEELFQFPPTTASVLIDCYRQRSSTLYQLQDLPVISASAVDYMRSPQLEQLLSQTFGMGCNNDSSEAFVSECLGDEREAAAANLYYQAQKLISLCGWEARSVSYVVDCKNKYNHSLGDASFSLETSEIDDACRISTFSPDTKGVCEEYQSDPNSVVLDCRLCGTRVGLWAFSMVQRPVELLRLVGHTDSNGVNNFAPESAISNPSALPGTYQSDNVNHVSAREGVVKNASTNDALSRSNVPNLCLTIAGGPLPGKQSFRARISLPIVGQNLRARLSSDMSCDNPKAYECDLHKNNLSIMASNGSENSVSGQRVQLDDREDMINNDKHCTGSSKLSPLVDHVIGEKGDQDKLIFAANQSSGDNGVECHMNNIESVETTQTPLRSGVAGIGDSSCPQINDQNDHTHTGQSHACIEAASSIESAKKIVDNTSMEFDPIRQHRYFCPWIATIGDRAPGWKQTLDALLRQQFTSPISPASVIKVDDPLTSIRSVFMSPSSKRKKLGHG